MRFFEYYFGAIRPLEYPMASELIDGRDVFLIYAENEEKAEKIAEEHLASKPLCVMHDFVFNDNVVYAEIRGVAME